MEGLQGYGSDLSDDSAPAAPTAPEMEVEMLIAQKLVGSNQNSALADNARGSLIIHDNRTKRASKHQGEKWPKEWHGAEG